eukprot:206680_1
MASTVSFGYVLTEFIASIISILTLSQIVYLVCVRILFNENPTSKYKREIMAMIKLATMYWSSIIIESFIKIALLTDILIPFSDDCEDGECLQCSIAGKIKISLLLARSIILILIFYQVYNIYGKIQSHKCSLAIQLWLLFLIIIKVIAILLVHLIGSFSLHSLSDNHDYSVCHWDDFGTHESSPKLIFTTVNFVSHFITMMIFTLSFVIYTFRTLVATKAYERQTATLVKVIDIVIRHCILSLMYFFVLFLRIIFWATGLGDKFDNAMMDLFTAVILYMFFTFGTESYNAWFGWLHKRIFEKWNKRREETINQKIANEESSQSLNSGIYNILNRVVTQLSTIAETDELDASTYVSGSMASTNTLIMNMKTLSCSNACDDSASLLVESSTTNVCDDSASLMVESTPTNVCDDSASLLVDSTPTNVCDDSASLMVESSTIVSLETNSEKEEKSDTIL